METGGFEAPLQINTMASATATTMARPGTGLNAEQEPRPDTGPPAPAADTNRVLRGGVKVLYYVLAGFFFTLAILGVVLPVLPTTPFLLLTSYFLIRVSPRLHQRLMTAKVVGPILCDWHRHRGIRTAVRWRAVAIVALAIGVTAVTVNPSWLGLIGLVLCGGIGVTVILRLPVIDAPARATLSRWQTTRS